MARLEHLTPRGLVTRRDLAHLVAEIPAVTDVRLSRGRIADVVEVDLDPDADVDAGEEAVIRARVAEVVELQRGRTDAERLEQLERRVDELAQALEDLRK